MSQPSAKTPASSSKTAAQPSPALSQTQQFFSTDVSTRRSGGSGSGSSASRALPTPRNQQSSKPKHKQRKPFLSLDEDADAEVFSMQNPHGRRGQQSITHLMQFALPPRPSNSFAQSHRHGHSGSRRNVRATWGLGSGYHAVDKARYIHANYRFIVDPRGEYHNQAQDADVHLDWNNVLQIIASSITQNASCPICLGEPTAPRMAKCGHIFCHPCLIRYMHSEDSSNPPPDKKARWKKCPICFDSIYTSETRPVRWYAGQECEAPREGGDIVLRLVKRKPGNTLAMPRESAEPVAKGDQIPWYFAAEVMDYARVMKGSEDYMLEQYDETIAAIEMQEKEDELMFGEDPEWTSRAIRMLKEAKEKVRGIGNPPSQPKKPEQSEPQRKSIEFAQDDHDIPAMYLAKQTTAMFQPVQETETTEASLLSQSSEVPRTLSEMRQRQLEKPQPNEYLFYHGLQHYYLSPLDIRILKSAFGSYSSFPSSILPRVDRVSTGHIVDDDLRKKVKYLGHLPHGCEVAFLECDWKDLVPAAILAEFRPLLDKRRRKNDEKAAREEKERIRIEREGERELAHIRQRRRPSIPSTDSFFSSALPTPSEALDSHTNASTSPPWASGSVRPGFAPLASPSTSPSATRTVWGTAAVVPASPDMHALLPRDDDWKDDGWLQDWEKDLLDPPALVDGVEALGLGESSRQPRGKATGTGSGGKKGKKGKKITLMSTANGRRGA